MRFTVPQFIEHEAKIVGPLTFKQFIYFGIAGSICFILYFSVPFSVFFLSCIVLGMTALVLAFLKIGGRGVPTILSNFLRFSLTPKMYIWKKSEKPITVFEKEIKKDIDEAEEGLPLKIVKGSRLKKLSTEIETKTNQ
ncbi:MAG: hypothetical protein A2175_01435 [Candidatus Nealsonbacteria bacterium RBG_13_42_11]|uniref:PrgI family protein n=1 Tax=Candidatus Nealsonbacteria bacterium RBG_13_42_11 TaxID=1801663 RepID=A0A1G2DZL8_9BACT|nr:MAG: hypothetical protein A2175_01435 [Candidatus Nealsonbacteria bacterium RBG_13_42_11]